MGRLAGKNGREVKNFRKDTLSILYFFSNSRYHNICNVFVVYNEERPPPRFDDAINGRRTYARCLAIENCLE
uniref:Uncharacterized protein n=1 Tax=Meloidogyne enterolobii TaxID=390850 RepID=A0A6V7VEH4_MELEN|nr:unnamed protein product [Meloidogyne enterolobii]